MSKHCFIWVLLTVFLHGYTLHAQNDCIDLTDLSAPYIHCTYGTFKNPYKYHGIEPHSHRVITEQGYDGTASYYSGHQMHQLQKIPPGETYSILLGNANGGARAESITVDITIDTNIFDLLILKYAAVLEDPSHAPIEQPRFRFEVVDSTNNPIDTDCLSADFIANPSLGWNHGAGPALWKDWTSVGFDVAPFHDQTIHVRLTTFDCAMGGHFGYAYFLLTCGKKRITVNECGGVAWYSYSAPIGFNYDWFWLDDPDHAISHNQTAYIPSEDVRELGCHVSFTENPSCGFDLFTTTKLRFPLAGFSVQSECSNEFLFINESLISNDGVHPDGTGDQCSDVFWDFGDGQTSDEFNPSHTYFMPGDHTVTMVAGLNDFMCTDTAYFEVHIPENTMIDTMVCEPFLWADEVYLESGEYQKVFTTALGCDSLVSLKLDANFPPDFTLNGNHWPIGGTELAWTEYTYELVFDNPFCSVDSIRWSVACPMMVVLPDEDGMSCQLKIFSYLSSNDSIPLRAIAYNRCGIEERTIWIHTSFYGENEHASQVIDLIVFPNPNSGRLHINTKGMIGEVSLEWYDYQGALEERWTRNNTSDDETFVYDVSHKREGLYTLRIIYNARSFTKKVMIKR